ncbi:hypothetical protein ACF0H5_010153 [Mactra antiquata]
MSFLSCIGKRSKKKKRTNEPIDRRLSEISEANKQVIEEQPENEDNISNKSQTSRKSTASTQSNKSVNSKKTVDDELSELQKENARLHSEIDALTIENTMYKITIDKYEHDINTHTEELRQLEVRQVDLKTRVTIAETEAAKQTIENQKLMQKIVGMEENQAMMSRAELHNMIAQLEETELKTSCKPASELSGIRTTYNPNEVNGRKRVQITQDDRQLSWRLSKTEARLSRTEDENKRLREDLKEMLDTHTELQQIIVADDDVTPKCQIHNSTSVHQDLVPERHHSVSTATETDDSDTDTVSFVDCLIKAEKDQAKLKQQYAELEHSFHELLSRLDQYENNINGAKEVQTSEDMRVDNKTVLNHLAEQEKDQESIRQEIATAEHVCKGLNERVDILYTENNQVKTTNDKLLKQNRNQKNELEKREQEIETLRNELNIAKNENKRLNDDLKKHTQQQQKRKDTGSEKKKEVENLEQNLADLKQKYEDANKRLKEYSANKIVQPTKSLDLNLVTPTTLAERFQNELYEHYWRQAFDKMTMKLRREEKKTIQILGEICTEAYLFCKRAARTQMETIASSLLSPTANHYRSNQIHKRNLINKNQFEQLPEDLRKRLLHYRSRPSPDFLTTGVTDFLNQIDYDRTRFLRHVSERDFNEIMPYISTCFDIVWGMSVQDPPMYLLFKVKHGHEIASERFERYPSHGKRVDYVMWPAVFREESGPCLQKGIVQALPERS